MRPIGSVLRDVVAAAQLPDADEAPAAAISHANDLLARGLADQAAHLLRSALIEQPTAFGWCRLGKLCEVTGWPLAAWRCYNEALELDPGDEFALVGRATVLARTEASPEALIAALQSLKPALASGNRGPALWAAANLTRTLSVQLPHPSISRESERLRHTAELYDQRTPEERRAEVRARADLHASWATRVAAMESIPVEIRELVTDT